MGRIEVHYGAELELCALRDTQPRGSSDYGTRSPSLLLRVLTQIWRTSPTLPMKRDIKAQNIPQQGVAIAF